jgi:predicted transcriptional regulator
MRTLQTALRELNYKPNYCPSSNEKGQVTTAIKEAPMTKRHQQEVQPLYIKAVELLQNNPDMTHTEAAEAVGVSQGMLSRYIRKAGKRSRRKYGKITHEIYQSIMEFHAKGWTNVRIAKRLKISGSSVSRVLTEAKKGGARKKGKAVRTEISHKMQDGLVTSIVNEIKERVRRELRKEFGL